MNAKQLQDYLYQPTEYELEKDDYTFDFPIPDGLMQSDLWTHPLETIQRFGTEVLPSAFLRLLYDITYMDGIFISKQDRYHAVAPHAHDWFELAFMYSGSCTIQTENQTFLLSKGQAILFNRKTVHALSACGTDDILINILIRKSYLTSGFFNHFSSNTLVTFLLNSLDDGSTQEGFLPFFPEDSERLQNLITDLLCQYYDKKSIFTKDIIDSYMALIILELTQILKSTPSADQTLQPQKQVLEILAYINQHFLTCTLESLSEHFHMNPNYLSGYIRKHTGSTYKELVQTARLRYAASLIKNTSLSTSTIANQAGYENITFFYRLFKKAYGCTPAQYRDDAN